MYHEIITPSFANSAITIFDTKEETTESTLCDWHLHQEVELFWLTKGEKSFYINDKAITMHSGDLIFVNSKVPHKTETPPGSSGIMVQFKTSLHPEEFDNYQYLLELTTRGDCAYAFFPAGSSQHLALLPCIKKISLEYTARQPSYETFIKAYVYELLAVLYRTQVLPDPNSCSVTGAVKLVPVLSFIHDHYAEPITLQTVSGIINVDKSYFCRMFKKTMNTSFVEYLNFVRIRNAQKLLSTTKMNITEIACAVGFSSVAYFIKIFKKYSFATPVLYRKLMETEA